MSKLRKGVQEFSVQLTDDLVLIIQEKYRSRVATFMRNAVIEKMRNDKTI